MTSCTVVYRYQRFGTACYVRLYLSTFSLTNYLHCPSSCIESDRQKNLRSLRNQNVHYRAHKSRLENPILNYGALQSVRGSVEAGENCSS